jgi:dehydrogenase E1 component
MDQGVLAEVDTNRSAWRHRLGEIDGDRAGTTPAVASPSQMRREKRGHRAGAAGMHRAAPCLVYPVRPLGTRWRIGHVPLPRISAASNAEVPVATLPALAIINMPDRPGGITPMQSLSPNLPPYTQLEMLRRIADDPPLRGARLGRLSGRQDLRCGACCIGEQAVAVGVWSALDRGDRIISTHRDRGCCIAQGDSRLKTPPAILSGEWCPLDRQTGRGPLPPE